jgi:zinc protease
MEGLTKEDVIDFHKKYSHPNNAILIVAGDVVPDEVKKLAEKYYGGFPKVEVPKRIWNVEPPQIAERKIIMHDKQVTQSSWSRVYASPSFGNDKKGQVLPLFVLSQVLGGGKTSKLYKALVSEQKIATSVNVGYNGLAIGAGEFSIDITPSQNVDIETIEKAADIEIAKFMADGVSDEELARAKTLLKAETIFARDGLSEIANIVGYLRIIGLPASYFASWGELVDKVSKEQILQAAKDTMRKEASVSAVLLPEEEKKDKSNN